MEISRKQINKKKKKAKYPERGEVRRMLTSSDQHLKNEAKLYYGVLA